MVKVSGPWSWTNILPSRCAAAVYRVFPPLPTAADSPCTAAGQRQRGVFGVSPRKPASVTHGVLEFLESDWGKHVTSLTLEDQPDPTS